MLHLNRRFLAIVLAMGGVLIRPAVAAPTVRNFTNATSTSAYGNMRGTAKPIQTQTAPTIKSASSARTLNMVANTAKNKGAYVGVPNTTGLIDSARTPGKHGNILKGISTKLSANYSSQPTGNNIDVSDLEHRIAELEARMDTKQDALEFGDGINIDGNTVSLATEITDLPDNVETMAQDIEDLSEQISPESYYTIEETQQYVQQIINQTANSDVVTDFDPSIFSKGQGGQH